MGDHLALLVNQLLTESTLQAAIESRNRAKQVDDDPEIKFLAPHVDVGDLSSPRKLVECRICQDEDFDSNMETPCSCCGSLKYAHRKCVQRWCNEKGDTRCEICHQPFKPGYQAPPRLLGYGHIPINIRRNRQIRRELIESQFTETASTHQTLLNSDFEVQPSSRTLIFRTTVAIIFLGLLVLRHTLPIMVGGAEFILPLVVLAALRISGILLLVYVAVMAVAGLKRHRRQEEMGSPDTSFDEEETEQLDIQQISYPHSHSHSHVVQIS